MTRLSGANAGHVPFPGGVVLVAPHMDDETLGCGALIAKYSWADALHVAFATDGARSPERRTHRGRPSRELPEIRRREALEAMAVLGLTESNVHFFDLPDGGLEGCQSALSDRLLDLIARVRPAYVLVPFRYDRHPDHLAVNRVAFDAVRAGRLRDVTLVEYFVYMKWRLLPSGDVRAYLPPDRLVRVELDRVALKKRRALECYRSQTTLFYDWQSRPILTRTLLDSVCGEPEIFLTHGPELSNRSVFVKARTWIPVAHRLEPVLKRGKDRVMEWLRT